MIEKLKSKCELKINAFECGGKFLDRSDGFWFIILTNIVDGYVVKSPVLIFDIGVGTSFYGVTFDFR